MRARFAAHNWVKGAANNFQFSAHSSSCAHCSGQGHFLIAFSFTHFFVNSCRFSRLSSDSNMAEKWKNGLCGCMGDCESCKLPFSFWIINKALESLSCFELTGCCGTFCHSCLIYKNAESLNKSGFLCCLLGCFFPCIPLFLLRSEAREKYGIEVSWRFILQITNGFFVFGVSVENIWTLYVLKFKRW